MPSDVNSARQGASIAFHEFAPRAPASHPHPQSQHSNAAAAAAFASAANRRLPLDCHDIDSAPGPEVGSVKDKIERFTANTHAPHPTSSNSGPSPARGRALSSSAPLPTPQQIAARLAADWPLEKEKDTPSTIASIGAIRSVSRAELRPSAELERRERRGELLSPAPIRPVYGRISPLDNMLRGDEPTSEQDHASSSRASSSLLPGTIGSRTHDWASSSLSSRQSSVPPEPPKPRVPRRGPDAPRELARILSLPGTPLLRASTPSLASLSGLSHNNSSSSLVDVSSGMSEDALSDAIVASTLASARASPVTKGAPPPPPPQRRRARSILHLSHKSKSDQSRTPSPPKGMPHTLRGMPKADEGAEAYRRHRRGLMHKHPHKHHEGDRKRWRREVSEKERKRYEGVWASNKGHLVSPAGMDIRSRPPNASEMVLNLVVREIWSRSRLGAAVLEQVWDLVDRQHIGLLIREEFVVGMWLIDQQLKGHKLPPTVPDSIWDSVRHVSGIKISGTRAGS